MKLIVKSLRFENNIQKWSNYICLLLFFALVHTIVSFHTFKYYLNTHAVNNLGSKQVILFNDDYNQSAMDNLERYTDKKIEVLGFSQSSRKFIVFKNSDIRYKVLYGKKLHMLADHEIGITCDSYACDEKIKNMIDSEIEISNKKYIVKTIYYDMLSTTKFYNFLSDKSLVMQSAKTEFNVVVNETTFSKLKHVFNSGYLYSINYQNLTFEKENADTDLFLSRLNLIYKSDITGVLETLDTIAVKNTYFINIVTVIALTFGIVMFGLINHRTQTINYKLSNELKKLKLININKQKLIWAKFHIAFMPLITTVCVLNVLIVGIQMVLKMTSIYYIQVLRIDLISLLVQLFVVGIIGSLQYFGIKDFSKNSFKLSSSRIINRLFFTKRLLWLFRKNFISLLVLMITVFCVNFGVLLMNNTLENINYPESFSYDYVVQTKYKNLHKLDITGYLIKDYVKTDQFVEMLCPDKCLDHVYKTKVYSFASNDYSLFFKNRNITLNNNVEDNSFNKEELKKYATAINNKDFNSKSYKTVISKLNNYYDIWTTLKVSENLNSDYAFLLSSYELDYPINIKKAKLLNIFDNNMNIVYLFRRNNQYVNSMIQNNGEGEVVMYVKVADRKKFENSAKVVNANFVEYYPKAYVETDEYQNKQTVRKINTILVLVDIIFGYMVYITLKLENDIYIKNDALKLRKISSKICLQNVYRCIILSIIVCAMCVSVIFICVFNENIRNSVYSILKIIKESL